MGGLGLWVRSEWRSGWRALLGLALLIALGGGVTLAALAGARRADTAIDRFQDAVATPDRRNGRCRHGHDATR